jgi:hypothetical protein
MAARTIDYFDRRTSHGSTLSLITYADDQRVRELLAKLNV